MLGRTVPRRTRDCRSFELTGKMPVPLNPCPTNGDCFVALLLAMRVSAAYVKGYRAAKLILELTLMK